MGNLTEHFDIEEFNCRDGTPVPEEFRANVKKTAEMLEVLRAEVSRLAGRDCPLSVDSGWRTPTWNKKVGGEDNSQHLVGKAADVVCKWVQPAVIQKVALALQAQDVIGGVGCYAGFTHVDWGPKRRKW